MRTDDEAQMARLRETFCGALFGSFVCSLPLFTLYSDEVLKGMQAVITVAAEVRLLPPSGGAGGSGRWSSDANC